jgi:uncharacterized protein
VAKQIPFWKTKTLEAMSSEEWESLCDGCGRCCMNKFEDVDTGAILLTKVACTLLDIGSCQCSDYPDRQKKVPDCIQLTPEKIRNLNWLPMTCAYRLVEEERPLAWWHPLISGDPNTVHEAGISVKGFAKSERRIKPENLVRYLIADFPKAKPKPRKTKE